MTNDKLAALDKVSAAIKATEYKYFGDYEMSDDQREAVDVLVGVAEAYRAGELVPVSLDTDTTRNEVATAGLVERLEAVNDWWRAPGLLAEQAATALRTITAERDALAKRVGELEAFKTKAPLLCAAFRTTISGPDIGYVMQFKFHTMEEMHQADDEWRALRGAK